jgi:hypothetical protein
MMSFATTPTINPNTIQPKIDMSESPHLVVPLARMIHRSR